MRKILIAASGAAALALAGCGGDEAETANAAGGAGPEVEAALPDVNAGTSGATAAGTPEPVSERNGGGDDRSASSDNPPRNTGTGNAPVDRDGGMHSGTANASVQQSGGTPLSDDN